MAEKKTAREERRADRDYTDPAHDDHVADQIDADWENLRKGSENLDFTEGPGDHWTGDASEHASEHMFSRDPFKRAFPPGPDDPRKLREEYDKTAEGKKVAKEQKDAGEGK